MTNTIIMAVKKRICYKDRLKTHDPATITSIIEGRMNVEKYLERKRGQDSYIFSACLFRYTVMGL